MTRNENIEAMLKNKRLMLTLFLLIVALGVYHPALRIIKFTRHTSQFTVFRFKTEIDDADEPFSGRYVMLRSAKEKLTVDREFDFDTEAVDSLAVLEEDENGLAKVVDIVRKPEPGKTAIRTYSVWSYYFSEREDLSSYCTVGFPFERFDLGEEPTPAGERAFSEAARSGKECVLTVKIYANGNFDITGLEIGGTPIREFLRRAEAGAGASAAGQKN